MNDNIKIIDSKESITGNKLVNLSEIKCQSCELIFGIIDSYMGVITCPYCNEYVEG